MKLQWENTLLKLSDPIKKAILKLNKTSLHMVLIVDAQKRLLGTLTDGDVRRAFLKGIKLDEPVSKIMCNQPTTMRYTESREAIFKVMKENGYSGIPIVDEDNKVCDLVSLYGVNNQNNQKIPVLLLAGGFGRRLHPLTASCPKPMLKIGGVPILERIIKRFSDNGFKDIYVSVHYHADQIKDYFEDGSSLGVNIKYIDEQVPLGTAGSLSLLPTNIGENIIVMNGDILTSVNLKALLEFHQASNAYATMTLREHIYTNPFGVVNFDKDRLISIKEKPVISNFVSAGIYIINNQAINSLNKNEYTDMPNFLMSIVDKGHEVKTFPIHERWLDVGRQSDFQLAQEEYQL
ncbi:MAG: nucleotidyltransferase family protein [Gammaproteobacteria bacterium]|nr:nucleotidyltransferase family protein [Gammaproteobacteria bacterium]